MKKFIILLSIFLLNSCEEVIEVDLISEQPRLVIDASINWYEGTNGNNQEIKLTLSAPFFDNQIQPANNAIVTITDQNNNTFNFIEENDSGVYKTTTFLPQIDEEYTLEIIYNNEIYIGTEKLKSVTPIDYIEQNNDGGFSGEDIEIKAYYTDPANQPNYYLYKFQSDIAVTPTLEVYDDEFTDGNQIFAFYTEEDLQVNDEVTIEHYGISKQYYDFMFLLLQQISDQGGGPFETQPASVKGNCINSSNPNNYPFGYFRLSQAYQTTYIIN